MRALRTAGALALCGLATAPRLAAQEATDASQVYRRFSPRVVKIEAVEQSSGAKAAIGSGFHVSSGGLVVTNYHVISQLVTDPDRYRADLVDQDGHTRPATLEGIDVVHDLAVLRVAPAGDAFFSLTPVTPDRGRRLYSLGHPLDLGLSIVEGTYNGLLEHTLYPRIHFTGAINPGMSGGPTITADGRVVGVNVSTAGNEVSFLVPVERVLDLVHRVTAPGYTRPDSLLPLVARQLLAYQEAYVGRLFLDSTPTVTLGSFRVPTRPAPFFKCWGDADRRSDQTYESIEHQCSTDDYVFISGEQWSGLLSLSHSVLTSRTLNRIRFHALLSRQFDGNGFDYQNSETVTGARCEVANVRHAGLILKTAFCVRRYRKLPGLYDATFRVATLGDARTALLTTLTLSGVTFSNARRLAERLLGSLSRVVP